MNNKELTELYHEQFNRIKELEGKNATLKRDLSDSSAEIIQCHVEIEALREALKDNFLIIDTYAPEGRTEKVKSLLS